MMREQLDRISEFSRELMFELESLLSLLSLLPAAVLCLCWSCAEFRNLFPLSLLLCSPPFILSQLFIHFSISDLDDTVILLNYDPLHNSKTKFVKNQVKCSFKNSNNDYNSVNFTNTLLKKCGSI